MSASLITQFCAPLAVGMVFAIISFAATKTRRQISASGEVYRYPPLAGYLMGVFGSLFLCVPLLPNRGGSPLTFVLFFAALAVCSFAVATYLLRYRVVVSDTTLTFGSFRSRSVSRADIVDTDITAGGSGHLFVYLRDGERVSFSNMLGDLATLAARLDAGIANPGDASPQKLRDRGRRVLHVSLFIGVLVLMAVALFIWTYTVKPHS